jgi:hypothetical protein
MKVEIENYRGWDISFDTDRETFYAVSSEYDTDRTKESFAAVKKSIDDYIKDNLEFKPFKAIHSRWGGDTFEIKEFVGLRKDKRFIVKSKESTEQFSESDEKDVYEYSEIAMNAINKIKALKEEKRLFNEAKDLEINTQKIALVKLNMREIKSKYSI